MTTRLSWSAVSAFSKCAEKYNLSYNKHLKKKDGIESRAMILGSHVHAGIAAALRCTFVNRRDSSGLDPLVEGVRGIRQYQAETIKTNQTRYNWETRQDEPDEDYQRMMSDVLIQATQVFKYNWPRLLIDVRYQVASVGDVLGFPISGNAAYREPMVEWSFEREFEQFDEQFNLTGTIDAVLFDIETDEFVIIDWKTRAVIPDVRLIDLDGQLKLYAAVINDITETNTITKSIQWQLRSIAPKPVKLTTKNVPSMASISSTWEVWSASVVAMGMDAELFRDEMFPKMSPESKFTLAVESPITRSSSAQVGQSILQYGSMIDRATRLGQYPMMPSSMGCQFCGFKRICQTRINGGDVDFVIGKEFEFSNHDLVEEIDPLTSE